MNFAQAFTETQAWSLWQRSESTWRYYHWHYLKNAIKSRIRRPKQGAELPAHLNSIIYNSIFYIMAVWNRNESSKNVRGLVSWRFASSPGSTCGKDWTFQAFVLKQHQTANSTTRSLLPSTRLTTVDCDRFVLDLHSDMRWLAVPLWGAQAPKPASHSMHSHPSFQPQKEYIKKSLPLSL